MNNALLIALLAGLGGMVGWGSADFFAKKSIDKIGSIKSLVWAHIFGTLILFTAFMLRTVFNPTSSQLPTDVKSWLELGFFGVLQMIVYWMAYRGFEKGRLTILNPVFASYSGIVALLSIMFLGEKVRSLAVIALGVIFVGSLLLSLDFSQKGTKRIKLAAGLPEVALAAALAAVWTIGWDKFVSGRDPLSSAFIMYGFMSLAAVVLARLMRVKFSVIHDLDKNPLFLVGLSEAVAYLAISWGYSRTSLIAVVAVISGAFSVPTVLLAYLFLKERLNMLQILAVSSIIAGVVILSVS
ncbi:MAG: EamA family transporter [Candidatus Saccharimonadales bacterium]